VQRLLPPKTPAGRSRNRNRSQIRAPGVSWRSPFDVENRMEEEKGKEKKKAVTSHAHSRDASIL
jgi:hypothetical protein